MVTKPNILTNGFSLDANSNNRGDLTDNEKSSYINAVLCLIKKPSKLDQTKYPGAKTRYDDFVAVHMNQTLSIHGTVPFLYTQNVVAD
jgi:hypothetical protein